MKACLLPKMSIFNLRGGDNKKRKWRGGVRLFEEGNYFKYFGQRGNYSREAIDRGMAIIQGNMVYVIRLEVVVDLCL